MSRLARFSLVGSLVLSGLQLGCAAGTSADRLRARLARSAATPNVANTIIPFEVEPKYVQAAKRRLGTMKSRQARAKALIESLADSAEFGVEYANWQTLPANEALEKHRGNCFSFASILVGLARSLGLRAAYAEFTEDVEEVRQWGPLSVRTGHITALIWLGAGRYMSMEIGRPVRFGRWQIISDAEATAHYYNNRAFEQLVEAKRQGLPPRWKAAERALVIATKLAPDFYRAWNNLGVVKSRLGDTSEAIAHYRRAIEFGPRSSAAPTNLARLLIEIGQPSEAEGTLTRASEVDTENPRIFYLLGMARWRSGRAAPAVEALQRAIALDEQFVRARELLAEIEGGESPGDANDGRLR